jgi:hypothetical protein
MSQKIITKEDIQSVDASQVNESADKSFISTTEKSKLSSITAIFTTELKALYDAYASAISGKLAATKEAIEGLLTGEITTHTHTPYPQTDLSTASGTITLATNTVTNLTDTSTGTLTLNFGTSVSGKANDYGVIVSIGAILRTINWDSGVTIRWKGGTPPTLAINKTYYFVASKRNSTTFLIGLNDF